MSVMLPKSVDLSSIIVTVDVPESVQAPVERGQEVGTATMSYAGEAIATVTLVAAESVAPQRDASNSSARAPPCSPPPGS